VTDAGNTDWRSPSGNGERPAEGQTPGAEDRPASRYGEYAPPVAPLPPGYPPASPVFAPVDGGWRPPPRPGLVPLRPLGFGTLLGAPFLLLRRIPGVIGLSLLLQIATFVLGGGLLAGVIFAGFGRVTDFGDPDQQPLIAGSIAGAVLAVLVLFALSYVSSALLQGLVVDAAARASLGERPALRALWARVRPSFWRLVGWTLLLGVAVLVFVLLLAGIVLAGVAVGPVGIAVSIAVAVLLGLGAVVLWLWLTTKLSVVPSALVLERTTIRVAIRRSWSLTDQFFWRTFGVEALVFVIVSVAGQIITTPVSLISGLFATLIDPNDTGSGIVVVLAAQLLTVVVSIAVGALTSLVVSAVASFVYLDLRMRKEGLDLVLQRHVEGEESGDPFAVPAP
jgi:membrane-anchored glycerophosphoryl diester phosphodiesterase (GDPDase)